MQVEEKWAMCSLLAFVHIQSLFEKIIDVIDAGHFFSALEEANGIPAVRILSHTSSGIKEIESTDLGEWGAVSCKVAYRVNRFDFSRTWSSRLRGALSARRRNDHVHLSSRNQYRWCHWCIEARRLSSWFHETTRNQRIGPAKSRRAKENEKNWQDVRGKSSFKHQGRVEETKT